MKTRVLFFAASIASIAACVADSAVTDPGVGTDAGTGMDSGAVDSGSALDAAGGDTSPMADTSGPFDGNLYGNLELWVSSDVGVTQGDASDVLTWTDRSSKGRMVTMPDFNPCVGSPTLKAAAIHGLPALDFNGANQCLFVSGAFSDFSLGLTSFVVFQPGTCGSASLGNLSAVFDSYNDTVPYAESITIGRNPTPTDNATGEGQLSIVGAGSAKGSIQIASGGASWVPAAAELLEFRLPAGTTNATVPGTAFVNGTAAAIGTNDPVIPTTQPLRTATRIGHNGGTAGAPYPYYCGLIGEMLIYSKGLSDNDRHAVEAYLKTKWGL